MSPKLDDLFNDDRLARIFSDDPRPCALQLWILQIKIEDSIENRVVYGRLLPYNLSDQTWHAPLRDYFQEIVPEVQAQVIRVNLYLTSTLCKDLLRKLSGGRTISEISEELTLILSEKLKARFGTIALPADKLVYRPVSYLLNRSAFDLVSPASPHEKAGAFSASITQTDKGALFRLGEDYDVALTTFVVKRLNEDTGQDFSGTSTTRFGDIELLVFPTLNDHEQSLLNVRWDGPPHALVPRFNPMQLPNFSGFQFRLSIENDGQIAYSAIATAERNAEGVFECVFNLSDQLRSRTDSTELEIFGFQSNDFRKSILCCRSRIGYIREIITQGHISGHRTTPVKFDWLERTTRPSASERMRATLTIDRSNLGFKNRIGGREADPWVPSNHVLKSLFERLHPPKSEGRFFLRWGKSNGEGRLQFVEWFKALLAKYEQHQVLIFDPYFDGAGLSLLFLCAAQKADYIVFTSLPKPKEDQSEKTSPDRINNLVASCEQNSNLLKCIKLQIFAMKNGFLHDRYILIIGPDGLPVKGFNLSNSLQAATQDHPLLVTPIPADTLLDVEQYVSGLVKEAQNAATPESQTENSSMKILFHSTGAPTVPRWYEPLSVLEKAHTGDVLSIWTGESSLRGLSGDPLKERMATLNFLKDNSIVLPEMPDPCNFLPHQGGSFSEFTSTWEVLGELLAHSRTEASDLNKLISTEGFLEFLAQFLKASFSRANDYVGKELALMDPHIFMESLETLLHRPLHLDSLSSPTKYATLKWSEYFAIKLLWKCAPDTLLAIVETQTKDLPKEPQNSDVVRLSLLNQIVGVISMSVLFDISEGQRNLLVRNSNGLLHWMGLNAIEMHLQKPEGLATVLRLVSPFTYPEKVQALGWMIHHVAGNPAKAEIYKGLVEALLEALPATIPAEDLRSLVNSMLGHMWRLAWTEPWLFQDVVNTLLQNGRANTDDVCEIWVQELIALLESEVRQQSMGFDVTREGQLTKITASLFANSSPDRQQASLKLIQGILNQQSRIILQPLASISDWTRWNNALVVSMWILTFVRWGEYFLSGRSMTNSVLERLSQESYKLAMVRPIDEWRREGLGEQGELAKFLDQREKLAEDSNRL